MDLGEVKAYVHAHIPITACLEADFTEYSGDALVVEAPLEANINHRHSAFGGSMSAIGILSGWGLLFIKLRELGMENTLVIQSSSFEFGKPAVASFQAVAKIPSPEKFERFVKMLKRKGRARLGVESEIFCEGEKVGVHRGEYVALLLDQS
ncbi:YiiD C-terminal domain-containing protein [Rubritalea tangerina]|uniref:YiiD C-terminal domain-containing protein n=1 Tax=Rubritalea tangerina TaxID=430798 RepID=A0ABW4ZBC1_9BACT